MKYFVSVIALLTVLPSSLFPQDTVHVKTGWNLIGSVKKGTIPDVLNTIPDSLITSSYWGYTPGVGYESTDTLINGTGYWVKAKSDGQIVFNNTPPVDSCKSKAFIYEGKLYHTVKIGEQCWMAENLDVGTMVTGVTNQTDNDTLEKYCSDDDQLNCILYGGLYLWDEAMQYSATQGSQGICPPGWHIPTVAQLNTLTSAVSDDGNSLKGVGQGTGAGIGTNTSGFCALLAGGRQSNGSFSYVGVNAYFWSSTQIDTSGVGSWNLAGSSSTIAFAHSIKNLGSSVRCLED